MSKAVMPSRSTNSGRKRKPYFATNGARRWRFPPKLRGRREQLTICASSCRFLRETLREAGL